MLFGQPGMVSRNAGVTLNHVYGNVGANQPDLAQIIIISRTGGGEPAMKPDNHIGSLSDAGVGFAPPCPLIIRLLHAGYIKATVSGRLWPPYQHGRKRVVHWLHRVALAAPAGSWRKKEGAFLSGPPCLPIW
jgi:hypothetical protein